MICNDAEAVVFLSAISECHCRSYLSRLPDRDVDACPALSRPGGKGLGDVDRDGGVVWREGRRGGRAVGSHLRLNWTAREAQPTTPPCWWHHPRLVSSEGVVVAQWACRHSWTPRYPSRAAVCTTLALESQHRDRSSADGLAPPPAPGLSAGVGSVGRINDAV